MRRTVAAETIVSVALFAVLAWALRKYNFVMGNEVAINFFFAHFVGTAVFLCWFVVLSKSRLDFMRWLLLGAVAVHLTGWFYPFSAIQLAVASAALRARLCEAPSVELKRRLSEGVASGLVLCSVAIVHPAIIDMIWISSNDGGISISDWTMIICSLTLMLLGIPSLVLIRHRNSNLIHIDALVALTVGIMSLCLLQMAVLSLFGLGSAYAIKKSGFLVGTLVLVVFSCIAMEWPAVKKGANRISPRVASLVSPLVGPLLATCSLVFVFWGQSSVPVRETIESDRQLQRLVDNADLVGLQGVTVSMNSAYNHRANYISAFARLHPRGPAYQVQFGLLTSQPRPNAKAEFAVVNAREADRYAGSCQVLREVEIAVVRWECVTVANGQPSPRD